MRKIKLHNLDYCKYKTKSLFIEKYKKILKKYNIF